MKLNGKVAVITGGNSGIGLATAKRFAEEGAALVLFGRNADTLEEAKAATGPDTLTVQGDVTNLADLDRLYEEAVAAHGKIDILVVNAGLGRMAPLTEMTEEVFDLVSDINFKGAFFTVQKAVAHLNDGASVILLGSVASVKGMPGFSVYSAAKAAVRSMARSFTAELAGRGIRVNSLSPGPIATPFFTNTGLPQEITEQMGAGIQAQVPLGRFGEADEMANVALFLASDESSYVAGTEIEADGGMVQV
ncbi:MAG: glucose 1-dehydrogenase [Bacteroidota bacterium]